MPSRRGAARLSGCVVQKDVTKNDHLTVIETSAWIEAPDGYSHVVPVSGTVQEKGLLPRPVSDKEERQEGYSAATVEPE